MKPFRVAIAGSGFMGMTHAAAAARVDGMQLAAIAGGRRAAALAASHGVPEEPTVDSLAGREDVDGIVITTPHHLHAASTVHALERGKHVLVEKPMATTLADCDAMNEAARKSGCVLALGFQQRHRRNNREARRLIREGALGDVHLVQVNMLVSMAPMLADPGFALSWHWWLDPRSVGHIINSGPHAVDLLRWMLGADVRTVTALCRATRPEGEVEDTTAALLEFGNRTICALTSSCVAPAPSFPGEEFRFRFLGSKAVMDLDPFAELCLSRDGQFATVSVQQTVGHQASNTLLSGPRLEAYQDQLRNFAAAARGLPAEIATGADGKAALAACLEMIEASAALRKGATH